MPYNSGIYSPPSNSWNPAVQGTEIDPNDWASTLSDISSALSTAVLKDGTQTITANLPLSGFKFTGVNLTSGLSSRSEFASGGVLQDNIPQDAGLTAGSSTVYTATLVPAIVGYTDKACYRWQYDEACGASPTINLNSLGAKKIYKNVGGTAVQLAANDVPTNFIGIHRYDTALDGSAGGFWLLNFPNEVSNSFITDPTNFTLVSSVAANALTIAVKGLDGNDPSATNPVRIPFPNQTGGFDVLTITTATSLVVPDTATLGTANAVLAKLWIVGFNDASTFRLGIVNTQVAAGIFAFTSGNTYSSTTISTGADSAGVFYSGTGVTTKAMVPLGLLEVTEATAGTWATAPSKTVLYKAGMPLPGTMLSPKSVQKTDQFTTTSTSFADITGATITVTLQSAANRVIVNTFGTYGQQSQTESVFVRIMRDATAIAIGDTSGSRTRATAGFLCNVTNLATSLLQFTAHWMDTPNTTSVTYKLQMQVNAGTGTLGGGALGDANTAEFGTYPTSILVTEIVA